MVLSALGINSHSKDFSFQRSKTLPQQKHHTVHSGNQKKNIATHRKRVKPPTLKQCKTSKNIPPNHAYNISFCFFCSRTKSPRFALGAMLYEMLFRTSAFVGPFDNDFEVRHKTMNLIFPLEPCGRAVGSFGSGFLARPQEVDGYRAKSHGFGIF